MENSSKTLSKSLLKDSQSSSDPVGIEIAQEGKVDGQPDHQVYRKRKVKLYTTSVFIVVYNVFTIAASSGLLLCALWPLCERLDGNRIHLGEYLPYQSIHIFLNAYYLPRGLLYKQASWLQCTVWVNLVARSR